MKTYGFSITTSRFLIVYLEQDKATTASFIQAFSHRATIVCFEDINKAWSWFEVGNRADLVIANVDMEGLTLLEQAQASQMKGFPPVILTAETVTTDLQQAARLLEALDVFPTESVLEKLNLRIAYLIQKKTYMDATSRFPVADLPRIKIPVWKRSLDILVALVVLTLLSPVLMLAAALIYLEHPGPVFYSSKRVGKDYKVFDMYKFRSMRPNSDQLLSGMAAYNLYGKPAAKPTESTRCENCLRASLPCQHPLFLQDKLICEQEYLRDKKSKAMFSKFQNDPRITRVGTFLRNTSIDELPQLFNILRGDMSLVGNRPLPVYEAERLTISGHAQRFAAPAGLTGLWQVTKRGKSKGVMSDLERIRLDIQYAEQFSFRTDLTIMLKTVTAVFQQENV